MIVSVFLFLQKDKTHFLEYLSVISLLGIKNYSMFDLQKSGGLSVVKEKFVLPCLLLVDLAKGPYFAFVYLLF